MLSAIINPRWWSQEPYKGREFNDILLDWDRLIAQYETSSSEVISNSLRCATIIAWCPKNIEMLLRAGPRSTRTDHVEMRRAIRDAQLGASHKSYVPQSLDNSSSMEVDAILNRTSAASSTSMTRCGKCGKIGHSTSQCWHIIGFPSSAKGGGKGKEDGKGKKGDQASRSPSTSSASTSGGGKGPQGPKDMSKIKCFKCKKLGHYKKDCKEDGTVGAIEEDEEEFSGWCLACENETLEVESPETDEFVMLDGGADEHCCKPTFAPSAEVKPTDMSLRDVQKRQIPLHGQKLVPMIIGDGDQSMAARGKMQVGDFSKNLFFSRKTIRPRH